MGTTRFKGPIYGAKALLAVVDVDGIGPGTTTDQLVFEITVPAGEDWYLTNVSAYCSDQGDAGRIDVKDDGVSVLGSPITLVTYSAVQATVSADGGEDEGKRVAGGSVLTVNVTVGPTSAATDIVVSIYGYIRKVDTP